METGAARGSGGKGGGGGRAGFGGGNCGRGFSTAHCEVGGYAGIDDGRWIRRDQTVETGYDFDEDFEPDAATRKIKDVAKDVAGSVSNGTAKGAAARARSAFSIIELLVVLFIIGVLLAILLPTLESVRHRAYIDRCASNLHQIGQAMTLYATENTGSYPRGPYEPGAPLAAGTGASADDPFAPGGPTFNDVTVVPFLLLTRQKLPPSLFICPYNDETEFTPDLLAAGRRGNFTNYRKNLAYSFANPYPDAAALEAGFKLKSMGDATFAVAADLNPGVHPPLSDVTMSTPNPSWAMVQTTLSRNHERDGQNVLYGDGHVEWQQKPWCGTDNDNIYTSQSGGVLQSPKAAGDSVLLPAE